MSADRTIILMYHHAGEPPAGARKPRLFASAGRIASHVALLRGRGFRFDTVSAALAKPAERLACLTFDDGYADVVTQAFPLLEKLGVPATVYVVTRDVGGRSVSWPEENGTPPSDLATWEELRALARAGWEVGSHAADHVRLARQPEGTRRTLIEESKAAIEGELGSECHAFAYPYGSYDAATLDLVRAAGFRNAVTTVRGCVRPQDDPFQLRRIAVHGHGALASWPDPKLWAASAGIYPLRTKPLVVGANSRSNRPSS